MDFWPIGDALRAIKRGGGLSVGAKQIKDLDNVADLELGKGYQTSDGIWGWVLEKNDVLAEAGRRLTDSELIKAFRASKIVKHIDLRVK